MAKRTNSTNNFKGMIESRIGDLVKAETTAHEMLALLSRDLLTYVPDTGDIDMVNRLLDACKTKNRDYAVLFFKEHLPWNVEQKASPAGDNRDYFTSKSKNKAVVDKRYNMIAAFLADENATIWTWVKANVRPPVLTRNFVNTIENAVHNALFDEKSIIEETVIGKDGKRETIQRKPTLKDILLAVQAGGVSIVDILDLADTMKSEQAGMEAEPENMAGDNAPQAQAEEKPEAAKPQRAKAAPRKAATKRQLEAAH